MAIYVVKTEGVQELTIQPVQAFGSAIPLKGIPVLSPISNTPLQGCIWNVHSYENDRPRKADKAKSQYTTTLFDDRVTTLDTSMVGDAALLTSLNK